MGSNTRIFARIIGLVALGLVAFVALFGGSLQAQAGVSARLPGSDHTGKIDKQVLKDTANGQKASFVILLADQADVSAAYAMKDQDARGWYVYNTLRDQAAKTQGPIRAALTAAGTSYQSYWAANMIVASGDLNLVQSLAARPDVRVIESNKSFKGIEDPAIANYQPAPVGPNTTEWGVNNVNAPAVWALGYTGQGIVVANEDTGMRWTHNALKPKYRGWNGVTADHNYNWWDAIHDSIGNPCGNNSQQPCDDQGHGTHTTGTIVGDDGTGNQIGVAPGAKWIGCRNMDANNGTPARYTECFQFFIAPTDLNGQNPNPALRPHIINNSWECPPSEGCAQNSLEVIVNNTQAAGIFVEASAQNSGPGCSTVQNPTAIYSAVFSTGAIDINNTLAGFSSRGPSLYYNPPLLKPNISAPGVNNRSSYYTSDSSYANLSGTSMAGPHVVGVVALIWSARPSLVRDITATKELLQNTANPNVVVSPVQTCGGIPSSQIPNNSFGYGRVDALAAYNASGGGTATPTVPVPTNTPTPTAQPATSTPTAVATATACGGGSATWTPGPTLTPARYAQQAAVGTDNKVYVAGGQTTDATPTVYAQMARFDPGTNSWGTVSPIPNAVSQASMGASNGKVYVAGGFTGGTSVTNVLHIYDIATDTWSLGAPIPTSPGVEAAAGAVVNGKFYVMGGDDFTNALTQTFIYDIATNTWTTGANVPDARTNTYGTAVGSLIYVFGGVTYPGFTTIDTLLRYDPAANSWTNLGSAGTAGLGNYGAVSGYGSGKLLISDGADSQGNASQSTNFFDITSGTFSPGPPMITPRAGHAQAMLPDGRVLVVDGFTTSSATTSLTELLAAPASCVTSTPTTQPTNTPSSTVTMPPPTSTHTPTSIPSSTSTPTTPPPPSATDTPQPTQTPGGPSATPVPSNTTAPTQTPGGPSATPAPSNTPVEITATPTACTLQFSDVPPNSTFYPYIHCLVCLGIVNGYPNGTFRPNADVTRGQLSKIVANSAGFDDTPSGQQFQDVPPTGPDSTFYVYIYRLVHRGYINGYACGLDPSEPCVPPANLPYFRPNNPATRGQISKIVSNAAGFNDTPTGQQFQDVAVGSTFYDFIYRLSTRNIINGYACGSTPTEPCVPPANLPYFRPNNNATRGQMAKIDGLAFFPDCNIPAR